MLSSKPWVWPSNSFLHSDVQKLFILIYTSFLSLFCNDKDILFGLQSESELSPPFLAPSLLSRSCQVPSWPSQNTWGSQEQQCGNQDTARGRGLGRDKGRFCSQTLIVPLTRSQPQLLLSPLPCPSGKSILGDLSPALCGPLTDGPVAGPCLASFPVPRVPGRGPRQPGGQHFGQAAPSSPSSGLLALP